MKMLIVSDYGLGDKSCCEMMIVSSAKRALCFRLVETRCHLAPMCLMVMRCVVCEVQIGE